MRNRSILLALCAALLAGCGSSHSGGAATATNVSTAVVPAAPGGFATFRYPGFSVQLPRAWRITRGTSGALLVAAQSGAATISVWRYPRRQPVPLTHASLMRAMGALVAATQRRHPDFRLVHARVAPVAHHGGIELVGVETLGGRRQQLRSTHLFVDQAEVVVDAYVAPPLFPATDQSAFLPVVYRLRVSHRP